MDPPSTAHKRKELSRDQRLKAQTLREAGLTYEKIAAQLHITQRQVQYACSHEITPQTTKRGRKPVHTSPSYGVLAKIIRELKENQELSIDVTPQRLGSSHCSEDRIRRALEKDGVTLHITARNPDPQHQSAGSTQDKTSPVPQNGVSNPQEIGTTSIHSSNFADSDAGLPVALP